jgi:hypothetical protein
LGAQHSDYDDCARLTYTNSRWLEPQSPIAGADGHNFPGPIEELVPGITAMIEDIFIGFEDAVGEPVVAQELPYIFDGIELGALGRQRDEADVGRDDEMAREMPASLIEEKHGMGAGLHLCGDFGEVQIHCLGVAPRQDNGRTFALLWANGAENISRGGALIGRR